MSPIQNKQILLTRPKQQSTGLQRDLESRGAIVHLATLIKTELIDSESNRAEISRLPDFDWVVFTSTNGVEYLFQMLYRLGRQMPTN
jgi:uroporphyrinogen III methyltransferase/synthase